MIKEYGDGNIKDVEDFIDRYPAVNWHGIVIHHCLDGNSLVFTENGVPIKIKDVKQDTFVYGVDDNYGLKLCKTKGAIKTGHKQLYKIQTRTRTVIATNNHPLLALNHSGKGGLTKTEYARGYKNDLVWKPVEQLKIGDSIIILQDLNNILSRETSVCDEIVLSDNMLQLIGFFIGDGSMTLTKKGYSPGGRGGTVKFHAISSAKNPYINIAILEFGKDVVRYQKDKGFAIYRKEYAELFYKLDLYRKCKEKIIPDWVFKLTIEKKLLVLRGIIDSDGTVSKKGFIIIRMANKTLIEQIRMLLISCGIRVGNIFFYKNKNGYKKNSDMYGISLCNIEQNRMIGSNRKDNQFKLLYKVPAKIQDYKVMKGCADKLIKLLRRNGLALDKINKISLCGIDDVYDLEIEDCHNFFADGVLVHNSLTKDNEVKDWEAIKKYHVETNKWLDIGYHLGLELIGKRFIYRLGRPMNMPGAACKEGHQNNLSIQTCCIGNYDLLEPLLCQYWLMSKLCKLLIKTYDIPLDNIYGHRDWATYKSCPGKKYKLLTLIKMIEEIK